MGWLYNASDLLEITLSIRDPQLWQSGCDFESLDFPADGFGRCFYEMLLSVDIFTPILMNSA